MVWALCKLDEKQKFYSVNIDQIHTLSLMYF